MKLKNKKTGEIIEKYPGRFVISSGEQIRQYSSLAELNEEWEDVEDAKELKAPIHITGPVEKKDNTVLIEFYTHEEAEKAAKKLRAWKRLKSCRFKFKGWRTADLGADKYYFVITAESDGADKSDLDLLFGGEE